MSIAFHKNDAPVLIVMGQSNAHGHGTHLSEQEQILTPYSNVYGLSREHNQFLNLPSVTWTGFLSHGMNLGESQDHTCCLSSEFARMWQHSIDNGATLPDLYVIQISIGAQGIHAVENEDKNMWWSGRSPVLIPGPLGEVDISLYPFAMHILSIAMESLHSMGKNPVILGIHWNQWETEVETGGEALIHAKDNYTELIEDLFSITGTCPFYFYRPISLVYENEPGRIFISELFDELDEMYDTVQVMDIRHSSFYDPSRPDFGIFQADYVHYHETAQIWFARFQYDRLFGPHSF